MPEDAPIINRPKVESAAVAGIVYAIATAASLLLIRAVPAQSTEAEWVEWIGDSGNRQSLYFAANLATFAAVAFLWFVAVVRRRLGAREDKFFSTVFLGSALVNVTLSLVAVAVVASPAVLETLDGGTVSWDSYQLAEGIAGSLLFLVSPRIQALFVASTSVVFLRTRIVPSWLGYIGLVLAAVLFLLPLVLEPLGIGLSLFVLIASVTILLTRSHSTASES